MSDDITFEQFRDEWLTDVREGSPSTTELGHRFAHKLLTQWRDIDDSSDDPVYCDGAGDGGIDIALLYRGEDGDGDTPSAEGHIWYLLQSKYGKAFQGVRTLLEEGQKVIDTLDGKRSHLSSLATGLLERLMIFCAQASERDHIILVFASEEPLTEDQKRALDDVRAMGRSRLGAIFDVESVSVDTVYRKQTTGLAPIAVSIRSNVSKSGEDLLIGSVTLLDLYEFLRDYRTRTDDLDQLYEKNVRLFLGNRGRVNKKMEETLQIAPERFGLYNNGITIVVTSFSQRPDGTTELIEPYVVNGCQTTRTIWEVCHRRQEAGGTGSSPEMAEWRSKARHGVVVTKIVRVGAEDESLMQAITRYTNTQNAVREKDFLALTSDFATWAKLMAEQYNVFLEVQRGGWDSRRALQRQKPHITQFAEASNAFDLLKVYGAGWLGEAGTAFGRNAAFLPNGTIFRRIINEESHDDPFGVDDLYAAYQLQKAADTYQFGRGGKRSRRQTRYLFYMVILQLLKGVLIRANNGNPTLKDLTRAMVKLSEPRNQPALAVLLDTAVDIVDEYLTEGSEDSVYGEPAFKALNSDLNGYLKWEQLGKTNDASPHLLSLLAVTQRSMGRSAGGDPSPRDMITQSLQVE